MQDKILLNYVPNATYGFCFFSYFSFPMSYIHRKWELGRLSGLATARFRRCDMESAAHRATPPERVLNTA